MKDVDKLNYGNWIPVKMVYIFLISFCIACLIVVLVNVFAVKIISACISVISGLLLIYIGYAYWLIGKNNGEFQTRICNALLDRLDWRGRDKALDIGTGSGRIAIYIAKRYPLAQLTGCRYGAVLSCHERRS